MIRYQIRNEYGLSNPKLYAPGEKDDPKALLEGVAMAGLVGVLRQLGDLAEFAAEIFHDLHEDVMATASRGHGLMLRLQQLEAEFPAVEKAIISQTDHSNYPHDDGVEWHANLQLNQNMITQGDMPRFILDSYEECHGPPHLFTLDKFDVAGAGASLKRYSDPSFFKTEHASNMIETDGVIGKKPRKIKKKAMRWRKGETLESLLVANSEYHSTTSKDSKDRASRKVPPRTTKLKSRHPQDSDHKTISRICREQLQEVISSQQKILSNYSARHYHAKFRSTDSSETASSFGELDNFSAPAQSSAKLELTKVVPINEYDTVETASIPISGSVSLEADDGQFLTAQHGPAEVEEVFKRSLVEQNGIFSTSEKLQEGPDFKSEESNCALQSVQEEKLLSVAVPVNQDLGRCRPDDIGSDQESFVDALNNMESEGEAEHEMKTKRDLSAKMEADKLNCHSKEGENALHVQFSKEGPAIDLSSGLDDSCHGGDTTCMDSYLIHDSSPSAVPATKDPYSDSLSCRQLNDFDWTNDEEPFNDVDLMDVSSSSSVLSNDNGNSETNDNLNGCEQNPEAGYLSSNDYHAAVAHSSDKQSPQRYSGFNGLAISSNDYTEKAYHSLEHGQNFVLDRPSMIFGKPNDVSQDDEEIEAGNPDDLLLHPTIPNQEKIQFKKQFEEGTPLDAITSPGKLASLSDMGPVMHMNDLELDIVAVPEEIVANTTPTGLDADDIHWHLDELDSGVAPSHSSMLNNPLYESHDDGILEDLHSLPDGDLYQHVAEDQEIVALGKGPCSTNLNTHKEDPVQASIVPRDFSNVQELPGLTESVSSPQDNTEAHAGETLVPSPCVLDDDTKPLLIGRPLASGTASLLNTSSSCVEHCESTDIGKSVSCGEVLVDAEVAEESTTNSFEDDLIPCEEVCTDGAKYTEKAEVLATNSREENSRHDVQLQASSPCREDLETVEATSENLGSLDESREHIFKESMLQTDNLPQLFESETTCETFSPSDDIQYLSPLHFPEESVCQEELPEETSLSAEVPCRCDLDKDGAVVSLKSNTVLEQPLDADQDLMREASAQDFFGTNPFMDPGYIVSHTPTDPSPSMSHQPCFSEEEQDFLSKLLIQHDNTGEKENLYPVADSLWEPATPPDEAPLPSEVMTEEDFRSFCHEYHEMDFTAVTEGSDNKPSSDSNDLSNDYVVSELEFPCSVSALPVGLDQEACVCSKPDSRLAECSSATGIPGKMPFSAKEDSDDETPGVDSDLKSHESFSDEKIPELDVTSVPLGLEQEPHALPGAGSHSSCLLDNGRIGEIYGSPSGIVPVKEEQETFANHVPPAFINEKLDELDVPSSNSVPVEVAVEASGLNEYDYQDIPCSSINEEINELDVLPVSKPFLAQESGVRVLGELDSQIVPSSSINEMIDDRDAPPLRTALEVEQESEDHMSGEHVSQIATSSVNEKMEELDAPPPSNAVLVEKEPKVCVPGELDSQIAPCSLTNEKIYELDGPPSSGSVLVKLKSQDNVSGGHDSEITSCSWVNDKTEPDATSSINVLQVELEQEAHSSPGLDSEIAPCSLNDNKLGEQGGPPSCNLRVESENGSYCSPEFDSQIAPYSSNSGVLAETSTITSTSVMPSTEEKYLYSPVSPPTKPFTNVSYEDPQKLLPLPPLQWRLGGPRLGLLSTKGHMPEPVRTNSVLPASCPEIDNRLGSLNGMAELIARVFSQEIKERYQNSMVENNDQRVEFGKLSTVPTATNVVRTEHDRSFSEACENIKHQGHAPSSETEAEEHLSDTGVTDGTALHQSNPLLPFPTYEHGISQQGPQRYILSSDTSNSSEHPSHTYRAASEDDKTVDNHNATGGMHLYTLSSSPTGRVSENGCYQQPQHGESFSETSDNKERSSNASYEQKNLKDQSITSGAPSDTPNHTAPGSMLEEGNSLESQNLQEQNVRNSKEYRSEGPSPSAESIVSQDYPPGDHNLEREDIHQPSPAVAWPGDKSNYVSGIDEGSYVHGEQPPVMGWTVGPQMLHPNYGILVEESRFEPEFTDHRLIRKPISIKNIPRNPLVEAVAAHDRSTMRKVSEIAAPTDMPKTNERNLLLEQIRNKTFNLKPVGSAKPTAMRPPARASTRNLKVAAIIEKANAIRQAVGSDDEDGDNWSDT